MVRYKQNTNNWLLRWRKDIFAGGISIAIIVMVYFLTMIIGEFTQAEAPILSIDGLYNGQNIDLSKPYNLDGQWEYAEGILANNKADLTRYQKERLIEVTLPSRWNTYDHHREGNPSFGFGTFFLTIQLDESQVDKLFGLKITNIGMSNKVFINGEWFGQVGEPSISKDTYQMGNVPYIIRFKPESTQINIAIQVANFDYSPYSGIVSSLEFGEISAIEKTNQVRATYETVFSTSYFVVGIVYFVLFINRRRAHYLSYFALYNFTAVLYMLTHGEKLWFLIFPNFSYLIFTKIQYFSAALNLTFFLLYLLTSFPDLFKNKVTKILILISCLFFPFVLTPLSVQSQFSGPQMLFFQFVMIFTVFRFVYGIVMKHEYVGFIGLSAILSLYMVNEAIGIVIGTKQLGLELLASQILWVLLHAFLIAIRLSKTYDLVDAQAKELVQMDKQKDVFLAKTSHEFKTPLHGIINITKLFIEREGDHLGEEDRERLLMVIDIASRLSRLVNDLLDISKIREGKVNLTLDATDVYTQLQSVIEVCQFAFSGRPCHIEILSHDSSLKILADRDRFRQVLYNLIENAIVYSKDGRVDIWTNREDKYVKIIIKDYGHGIPENEMIRIFQPFTQSEATSVNPDLNDGHIRNYGLGLSIVKELVEKLGGRIEVESKIGLGSTFTLIFDLLNENEDDSVFLPKVDSDTINIPSKPLVINNTFGFNPVKAQSKRTILVVDDNLSNLQVLVDAFSDDSYRILSCSSGQEVLERLETELKVDLLILDIMMPEISGFDISKQVRKTYSLAELPILFLTAGINVIDSERMLSAGANDFLYKPFQLSELRARVKSLVEMKVAADLKSQLEIAFLNAQIKPHFLYNALNTIAATCEDQSPEAADLIISLAKYLRGTLDFSNIQAMVPIDRELSLVKAYLNIEKARFPKLEVEYFIDNYDASVLIPPMSLQILVENAVKHGIKTIEKEGLIRIVIKRLDGKLAFFVEDDGVGFDEELFKKLLSSEALESRIKTESVGLFNLNQRLNRMAHSELIWFKPEKVGSKIGFTINADKIR